MTELATSPASTEAKTGRITGINHIVLVTSDMEKTMAFYCGLLGMRARATTTAGGYHPGAIGGVSRDVGRIYFLELPQGGLLTFAEIRGEGPKDEVVRSSMDPQWPAVAAEETSSSRVQKMDHLALNVDSRADLEALRERLVANGVPCSPVQVLESSPFVISIYLRDPNGIPLEIGTYDFGDSERWEAIEGRSWFDDPDPVPSLREAEGRTVTRPPRA